MKKIISIVIGIMVVLLLLITAINHFNNNLIGRWLAAKEVELYVSNKGYDCNVYSYDYRRYLTAFGDNGIEKTYAPTYDIVIEFKDDPDSNCMFTKSAILDHSYQTNPELKQCIGDAE